MGDLSDQKQAARKSAAARRMAVHSGELRARAVAHLLEFLAPYRDRTIAGYMAIRTEIDPVLAMADLARDTLVGVPVILGADQPLEFRRWQVGCQMRDGPYGARIPVDAAQVVPQVVILPLLAFDGRGHRLGYGGGYYDRTLCALRASGALLALGFAYSAQEVAELPAEATDQRLDAVVTENGFRVF
jgi:5-formyltetrahydrofolate cyclo-ligase